LGQLTLLGGKFHTIPNGSSYQFSVLSFFVSRLIYNIGNKRIVSFISYSQRQTFGAEVGPFIDCARFETLLRKTLEFVRFFPLNNSHYTSYHPLQ
jgi:hypothetical protein